MTHPSSLEGLARQRFPAVVLLQTRVPEPLGSVSVDERGASRLVVQHLRGLGHRRLAYYAASDPARVFEHLRLRRDAFLIEAHEAGVPLEPAHVLAGPPEALDALLASIARGVGGSPTAIVCAHEELAVRTLEAADRASLRVPEELSVVSWEVVGAPERAGRALTGVHIPIWEMGKAAAELGATMSRRDGPHAERHLTFAPTVQVGNSTGPPPRTRRGLGRPLPDAKAGEPGVKGVQGVQAGRERARRRLLEAHALVDTALPAPDQDVRVVEPAPGGARCRSNHPICLVRYGYACRMGESSPVRATSACTASGHTGGQVCPLETRGASSRIQIWAGRYPLASIVSSRFSSWSRTCSGAAPGQRIEELVHEVPVAERGAVDVARPDLLPRPRERGAPRRLAQLLRL